jgi:hypothetical protein
MYLFRNTKDDERWQYQWTGLPFSCERDVLRQIEGSAAKKDKFNGKTEWLGGRLRGMTFGPNGNFVAYRGEHFDWDGAFPQELAVALRKGIDQR